MNTELINKLEKKFEEVIEIMELEKRIDGIGEHIKDTPKRIAKMFVNELFYGVYNEPPKLTVFNNTKTNISIPVTLSNIRIKSVCSHHFVPFEGVCSIEYCPSEKIIGISKLSRIANYYSRRPQVQEILTKEIGEKIKEVLDPEYIAVVIKARHLCISHRGANESSTEMITTYFDCKYDKSQGNIIIQKLLNTLK